MRKTGKQIEADLFHFIKNSSLAKMIRGSVYRNGMRPVKSVREDAIVTFITGIDGQFQNGKVNVNIYVPDIDNGSEVFVEDISRTTEIEVEAFRVIREELNPHPKYLFSLFQIIQTFKVDGTNQHMVNVPIEFKLKTF